jgi:hypothetical protein
MPNQIWTDGQNVALVLPTNTFTDALGLKMTFAAYQVSGPNETGWLRFNAAAHEFTGTVPMTASGSFGLLVMATDALSMAVSDMFSVTFASGSAHVTAALTAGSLGSGSLSTPETMLGLLALHS